MTWIAFIFIVVVALVLLIVLLFVYYRHQNSKLLSKIKARSIPKLSGGGTEWPSREKMDEMFDLSEGSFIFNIPDSMNAGEKYRIVSKIALNKKLLLGEDESSVVHEILTTDLMGCKLSGEEFNIFFISNEIQKIFKNDVTQWQWDVIPKKSGVHNLLLLASIYVKTGNDTHLKDIPVFERSVVVEINASYHVKQFFVKHWQWLIGTIIGSGMLWEILKLKFDNG